MEASLKFRSLACFILILAFSIPCESASHDGFTVELVHRDSPRSPYYDPADTPYHRMAKAIRRSISSVNRLDPNSVARGVIFPEGGEYLMNITLGTPPVNIVGIADTGSDLIWTQCKPCPDCFKRARPPFDPHKSKTYKNVSCSSSLCEMVENTSCGGQGLCEYFYSYGDNSTTSGNLATETLSIGSTTGRPVSFPRVLFGCGHKNRGTFDDQTVQADGIIGLGFGAASLITQMGRSTGGKFSYCLVPLSSDRGNSSKLNFGANAVVTGRGTVSTPLVQKDPETYYYLTLEAVSVGKTRVEFPSDGASLSGKEGNIVIDSGTPLTWLPRDFYSEIKAAMVKCVKLPPVSSPPWPLPSLCYKAASVARHGVPPVTFHFKGADVVLWPNNSFVSAAEDTKCFTLAPGVKPGHPSIFGNLVQTDFLVGYDIQNMKLSFKPADCALH